MGDKLNEDNNDDNNEYEMVDAVNSNDNKSRDETPVAPNGDNPNLAPSNIEKMVSNSPSPNLTPSASQQRLDQTADYNRTRKKKHHRKNSTKTGFWAQAKKKPPIGTKAYWLYLDTKHEMNPNFAAPHRVQSWHHHEIAYWLKQIKCEKYAVRFLEEKVSGEQLTMDMNSSVLSADLGVKMLHCGKIMREIENLKISAGITFAVEEKVN